MPMSSDEFPAPVDDDDQIKPKPANTLRLLELLTRSSSFGTQGKCLETFSSGNTCAAPLQPVVNSKASEETIVRLGCRSIVESEGYRRAVDPWLFKEESCIEAVPTPLPRMELSSPYQDKSQSSKEIANSQHAFPHLESIIRNGEEKGEFKGMTISNLTFPSGREMYAHRYAKECKIQIKPSIAVSSEERDEVYSEAGTCEEEFDIEDSAVNTQASSGAAIEEISESCNIRAEQVIQDSQALDCISQSQDVPLFENESGPYDILQEEIYTQLTERTRGARAAGPSEPPKHWKTLIHWFLELEEQRHKKLPKEASLEASCQMELLEEIKLWREENRRWQNEERQAREHNNIRWGHLNTILESLSDKIASLNQVPSHRATRGSKYVLSNRPCNSRTRLPNQHPQSSSSAGTSGRSSSVPSPSKRSTFRGSNIYIPPCTSSSSTISRGSPNSFFSSSPVSSSKTAHMKKKSKSLFLSQPPGNRRASNFQTVYSSG
ncbi:hypothetical protein FKM82_008736 [Ascaphus truei]